MLRDIHSVGTNDYFVMYSGGSRLECLAYSYYTNASGSNCVSGTIVFSSRLQTARSLPGTLRW